MLSGAVRTWQFWRGDVTDPAPGALGVGALPAVRLMSTAAPGKWMDENSHSFQWPIRVDLDACGSDGRVALDFWEAFKNALFTGNTVLNQMIALKGIQKTLSTAAIEPRRYTDGSGFRASGVLTLLVYMDT